MATKSENTGAATRRRQYFAPALEKGLDILEILGASEKGLSMSMIAERLSRSVSEIFRMLAVLEQRGYVHQVPDSDHYAITLKLFELARKHLPVKKLTEAALPIMRKLAYEIEQSCHLVVYYQGKGLVIAQQDSPGARVFTVRMGAEAPLISSCSGHILLAFADETLRARMIEEYVKFANKDSKPLPSARSLSGTIRRVIRLGHERIQSPIIKGVEDIGYPVFDAYGQIQAALVVPFMTHPDSDPGLAQAALARAAAELSDKLGYRPTA